MSQPVVGLITLAGEPGASCEGDDCLVEAVAPGPAAEAPDED